MVNCNIGRKLSRSINIFDNLTQIFHIFAGRFGAPRIARGLAATVHHDGAESLLRFLRAMAIHAPEGSQQGRLWQAVSAWDLV